MSYKQDINSYKKLKLNENNFFKNCGQSLFLTILFPTKTLFRWFSKFKIKFV